MTDSNGLYYMRARYYNPDIKRFINQDIKVGDISNGQSLNRYAYCEGNPVSLVDPFGLSPETSQDQSNESKYQWLHNILGGAGFIWDGFDVVNGFLYMMEGNYVDAAISFACGIPAVGNIIAGVAKASKVAKAVSVANKVAEACTVVGKAGNVASGLKAAYDTHKEAQKLETTGEKLAYYGLTAVSSYVLGKTGKWAANKIKNLASKAMPKLKTTLRKGVDKLVGKNHFTKNKNKLISATQNRLHTKVLNGRTSKKKLGPAFAGVLDTKTGNIFFGENDFLGNEPTKIHPLIKTRIETAKTIRNEKTKGAGSHAEVYALNEALLAREDATLDDFMVYVISTKKLGKHIPEAGCAMPRCPHCKYITNGTQYLTPEVEK